MEVFDTSCRIFTAGLFNDTSVQDVKRLFKQNFNINCVFTFFLIFAQNHLCRTFHFWSPFTLRFYSRWGGFSWNVCLLLNCSCIQQIWPEVHTSVTQKPSHFPRVTTGYANQCYGYIISSPCSFFLCYSIAMLFFLFSFPSLPPVPWSRFCSYTRQAPL